MGSRVIVGAILVCLGLAGGAVLGSTRTVAGVATWPGERLDRMLLTEADFPPGVQYGRIADEPGGQRGITPSTMMSRPKGCSNGLTDVIAGSGERGPGSAASYVVQYDSARIVITVLTWTLDLAKLDAVADRCERFEAFFDPASPGIPITTAKLESRHDDQLALRQTMRLGGEENSIFMAFENVGEMAVFGIAFPGDPSAQGAPGLPRAELPDTFLDIIVEQADAITER